MRSLYVFWITAVLSCVAWPGHSEQMHPLRPGDAMPDIQMGQDFRTGQPISSMQLAEGMLIIIDFWYSGCASCIASFSKMEKLQKEFSGDIQILLVNAVEDSLQLGRRIEQPYFRSIGEVDLPIIVGAGVLKQLFPHTGVPHHVWIGTDHRVALIGSSLNTNSDKIRAYLSGEPISVLNNGNLAEPVTNQTSLHDIMGVPVAPQAAGGKALFSAFQNGYSPMASTHHEHVPVQVPGLLRNTYINNEVAELYAVALAGEIDRQRDRVVYSGPFSYGTSNDWVDYLWLDGIDTLAVTSAFVPRDELTDRQFIQSRYCYEEVFPETSEGQNAIRMLDDLNRYFGSRLGIRGQLREKKVRCYVLTLPDGLGGPMQLPEKSALKSRLSYLIFRLFSESPDLYLPYMIDETGLADVSDLVLPAHGETYSFGDIIRALQQAGIHCRQENRILKFIAIDKYY